MITRSTCSTRTATLFPYCPLFRSCDSGESPLAGLHELLRPGVILALVDPFLAAQLGNAVLAAQAFQHDPDLVFGREVPTRRTPDVLHHPLRDRKSTRLNSSH